MTDTAEHQLGLAIPEPRQPLTSELDAAPSHWQQARRWLGHAAVATAIVTPLAASGAELAVYVAPDAHASIHIAGGDISAKVVPGSNVVKANLQAANLTTYSHVRFFTKDIGVDVAIHVNDVNLQDSNGDYDTAKLQPLLSDYSDTTAEKAELISALETHYEEWAVGGASLVCGIGFLLCSYATLRRRKLAGYTEEERQIVLQDRRLPRLIFRSAVGLSVAGLVSGATTAFAWPNHPTDLIPTPALKGTDAAGSSITGPAAGLITKGIQFNSKVNAFYGAAEKNMASVEKQQAKSTAANPINSLYPTKGDKRIVFADDFQGQSGPARLVGDYARAEHASLIEIGGDITATESPLETSELDALRSHAGKNMPIEMTLGHHDDPATMIPMAERLGIHVADGQPHTINGLNITGFNAPDLIPFGGPDILLHPTSPSETIDEATKALTQKIIAQACAALKPTIVTMHDQIIGTPVAKANCPSVPIVLTGRQLPSHPPIEYGNTEEFISGSTGGHGETEGPEAFGIIHHPAPFEMIEINSQYQVVGSKLITLLGSPSTGVTITPNTSINQISPDFRRRTSQGTAQQVLAHNAAAEAALARINNRRLPGRYRTHVS